MRNPVVEELSIGEVARQAGIRASAIRYYEQAGLLPAPRRRGGQRRYEPDVVDRLALIAFAQQAGFTISEIRTLFRGVRRGDADVFPLADARSGEAC